MQKITKIVGLEGADGKNLFSTSIPSPILESGS